jgi:two-component system CheB/CheR fusion protein
MVGIGGSAGSIPALTEFFKAMPTESGMVFVVILHLSPTHVSTLAELLGRATTMKVVQAADGQAVEPNNVYVIPPGKSMATVNGHLRLSDVDNDHGKRLVVDLFFRSLADTHGPHAAAIILSGADGDGALGIKRIKERGGLTIAQDPDQAEYPGMPRASIDTGMIDWVLDVSEIPKRLVEYQRNGMRLKLPPEDGPPPMPAQKPTADESETALRDVLVFLRMRTGRDFSNYKRATILRRVARRMQVNGIEDLPAYLGFLRTHLGEGGRSFRIC